eukprot:gene10671-7415_t
MLFNFCLHVDLLVISNCFEKSINNTYHTHRKMIRENRRKTNKQQQQKTTTMTINQQCDRLLF